MKKLIIMTERVELTGRDLRGLFSDPIGQDYGADLTDLTRLEIAKKQEEALVNDFVGTRDAIARGTKLTAKKAQLVAQEALNEAKAHPRIALAAGILLSGALACSFSDGTPVTAQNIGTWLTSEPNSAILNGIGWGASIRAVTSTIGRVEASLRGKSDGLMKDIGHVIEDVVDGGAEGGGMMTLLVAYFAEPTVPVSGTSFLGRFVTGGLLFSYIHGAVDDIFEPLHDIVSDGGHGGGHGDGSKHGGEHHG